MDSNSRDSACQVWENKCQAIQSDCKARRAGPPNKGMDLTSQKNTIAVPAPVGTNTVIGWDSGPPTDAPAPPANSGIFEPMASYDGSSGEASSVPVALPADVKEPEPSFDNYSPPAQLADGEESPDPASPAPPVLPALQPKGNGACAVTKTITVETTVTVNTEHTTTVTVNTEHTTTVTVNAEHTPTASPALPWYLRGRYPPRPGYLTV